ncbi:MAG: GNAT family N-acetyltransferase [Chloroflexi bacterium]|nr:GNAT family N-acetyltransferase [Chloroflexota bacterium]
MTINVQRVTAQQLDQVLPDLLAVYRAVFSLPPYNEGEQDVAAFAESFNRQVQYPGFQGYVAQDNTAQVCGFSYGFTVSGEARWHRLFFELLQPQSRETWLDDCFLLVELAVVPERQGQGIGGRLHDAVLADVPHRRAILSTAQNENPALHLYWRRGWEVLAQDWSFQDPASPSYLLGLDLDSRRPSRR